MNQVKLDSVELKDVLKYIINNNRFIQKQGKVPSSVEIIGESGLGKTSVALQVAKEMGINFVKLNLAQIEELGDLVGFPIRQFELTPSDNTQTSSAMETISKTLPDGRVIHVKRKATASDNETLWVDETALEQYTKQNYTFTGKKRMAYCPPEWISGMDGGGILILDDWNRADLRFIQAIMEICDRQEYISWSLPKDWHVILTANPDDGDYLVNSIDIAQKTRFISVSMKWCAECWAEWAEYTGIDNRCINFVLMNPEIVSPSVNPRSLTTFFNCLSSMTNFEEHLPLIQMIGEGSVGPEAALLFTTFINNRLDKLVTPKEIFSSKPDDEIKSLLMDAITNTADYSGYRADIASVFVTRIINHILIYAENNPITDAHLNRLSFLFKDPEIFTDDLKYHMIKKIINGNRQKFQKLLFDKVIQEYTIK